jgi:PAS domain S-box-containing protein
VEESLRESEARLRAIYDGTYEYIGLLAADGTVLSTNRASLEFADMRADDVMGRPFDEAPWFSHTPGVPEAIRQGVRRAAAGEFVRFETDLREPSGEIRTFDISLHPVRDEHGNVRSSSPRAATSPSGIGPKSPFARAKAATVRCSSRSTPACVSSR